MECLVVLLVAMVIGCTALMATEERRKRLIEGNRPGSLQYWLPELLITLSLLVAFGAGAGMTIL